MTDLKGSISCGYLLIEGTGENDGKELYLELCSDRNHKISKVSDISEYDTTCNEEARDSSKQLVNQDNEVTEGNYEIWYPVADLRLDHSMEGVFTMEGEGKCSLNRAFSAQIKADDSEITVPASALEQWENILMTEGDLICKGFSVRKRLDVSDGRICVKIKLLSSSWSGRVRLLEKSGGVFKLLRENTVSSENEISAGKRSLTPLWEQDTLTSALKATVDYILRNQIKKEDSIFDKGLYLFYDHDARTFRQPSWIWTWGTAVHLLLEADKIDSLRAEYEPGQLLQAAKDIGEASLRFQKTHDANHPAYGLVTCRIDYDSRLKGGYMEFLSPPDSLFLAGWGWIPLYQATKDTKYLEASRLLVRETGRILKLNTDIIEQDYMIPAEEWKDWILDEAGFGMKGIAGLYACDPNPEWKEIGKVYIEQNLATFERQDGLWDRMWTRSTATLTKTEYHTRGAGWAMEGLLSSWELLKETQYLDKAAKMADCMIKFQNKDGSWSFEFDKKPEVYGRSEKGTAYWAGLLYRLYEARTQPRYLEAARKALNWCVENQYLGDDGDGYGGIIGRTPHSGVVYRKFFDLSCTYTSAFFGEALIMEMQNIEGKRDGFLSDMWEKLQAKIEFETNRLADMIPYMSKNGSYTADLRKDDISWWTNGFWAGILWQMYRATGKKMYETEARKTENWLDEALEDYVGLHHDAGFMWLPSAVANYRATKDKKALVRGLHAAGILAGRYNPAGRFIRAWNEDKTGWIIIDCMMNLPLLYWASEETKDPRFAFIAREHADTAARYLVKESGGCNHIAVLEEQDGSLKECLGGQGFERGSVWSRGTAWGIYGFALSYRHTKEERYLNISKNLAHYFISQICEDGYVSRCDFEAPKEPVIWDTSAAAIAACGLLELAEWAKETEGEYFKEMALRILKALDQRFCCWDLEKDGILTHTTTAYHDVDGRHVSLVYGDYFLIEAVLRLKGEHLFIW